MIVDIVNNTSKIRIFTRILSFNRLCRCNIEAAIYTREPQIVLYYSIFLQKMIGRYI